MMSSEIPSEKYSCSGSPLILLKGRTAIDGLSASASSTGVVSLLARGHVAESDVEDAHRELDVLELLLADIFKQQVEPVADIVAHRLRNRYSAGLGDAFEPRRDVDAVAENIVVVDDHIAKVDADAELDPPVLGDACVADRHVALDVGKRIRPRSPRWEIRPACRRQSA